MQILCGIIAILATTAVPEVRVTPVSGDSYTADWEGVGSSGGLLLRTDGQVREVPLDQLQQVQRTAAAEAPPRGTTVQLRGGTRLAVDAVSVQDDRVSLQLRRQPALEVPVRRLHWIRFQPPGAPAVESQWQGLMQRAAASDTLVIRRDADTLDQVTGIIQSVGETEVQFDLDGQEIKAPIARLEGVIFAGPTDAAAAPPVRLRGIDGSIWHASTIGAGGDPATIRITTSEGLEATLGIDRIQAIELASGVEFLAGLQPLDVRYQPYIGAPEGLQPLLQQWLGPTVVDDRDLVLRSRSSVSYRIEPGFRQFITTAQIDPDVQLGGEVQIRCLLDGKPVWQETLTLDGGPRGVEMPLQNARRLTIEVDYGSDGDVGDVVWMHEPRLIK